MSRTLLLRCLAACAVIVLGACASTADHAWPEKVVAFDRLRPLTPIRASVPRMSVTEAMPGGRAVLQIHVDKDGVVRRAEIVEGSGSSRQDVAAVDSIKQTRFAPHIDNGMAVPVTSVVPMNFPAMPGEKPLRPIR